MAKTSNNNTRGTVSSTSRSSPTEMPSGVTKTNNESSSDAKINSSILNTLDTLGKDTKDIKSFILNSKNKPQQNKEVIKNLKQDKNNKVKDTLKKDNSIKDNTKKDDTFIKNIHTTIKSEGNNEVKDTFKEFIDTSQKKDNNIKKIIEDNINKTKNIKENIIIKENKEKEVTPKDIPYENKTKENTPKKRKGMESSDKDKVKNLFKGLIDSTSKIIDDNNTALRGALLGPLNVVFKPFEDFFGGSVFEGFKNTITKGKNFFSQKFSKKKNPNETDVLSMGKEGLGFLYLGNIFEDMFGKKKNKEDDGNLLSKLFGGKGTGVIGGLGGTLMKALPIAGLIAGIIWMVIDGIKGFFMSGEWGVSKLSGVIGSVLGGTSSGLKGAFAGMGKWALIGAGIGSVVPLVGTLVGGLIGAGIGAILGWIGGEKIAKFLEPIVQFFKGTIIPAVKDFVMNIFNIQSFIDIWQGEGNIFAKLGKTLIEVAKTIIMLPFNLIKESEKLINKILIKPITTLFKKVDWGGIFSGIWGAIKNFFSLENMKKIMSGVFSGISSFFSGIGDSINTLWTNTKESPIGQFVTSLFNKIGDNINNFFETNPIGKTLDKYIISPITNFFSMIGDFFGYIGDLGLKGIIDVALSKETTFFGGFDEYRASKVETVDDAIIKSDGSIIRTHPDDNIIATKNLPTNIDSIYENNKNNLDKNLSNIGLGSNTTEAKLDAMIELLSKILNKETVHLSLPPQTRGDLDIIMNGGIL